MTAHSCLGNHKRDIVKNIITIGIAGVCWHMEGNVVLTLLPIMDTARFYLYVSSKVTTFKSSQWHCPDTLAPSYSAIAAREAKAVASEAERRKRTKYAHLNPSHHFVPIAVETLSAFGPEALTFIRDLQASGMPPGSHSHHHHLRQRVAVVVHAARECRGHPRLHGRCWPGTGALRFSFVVCTCSCM